MKFKALFLALALLSPTLFADETPTPTVRATEESVATRSGLVFNVFAGVDLHRLVGSNSQAVFTLPVAGLITDYHFGEVFGVFVSADYNMRGASTLAGSTSTSYIDAIAGISLRYRGNLFSSNSLNVMRLGALFSIPLGDYSGAAILSSNSAQLMPGIALQGTSSYPLSPGLWLGPVTWIKFSFANPVPAMTFTALYLNAGVGVQLSF